MIAFQCDRCGECCRDLSKETDTGRYGPYLLPRETRYFPKGTVAPYMAKGLKGRSRPRPRTIVAYQIRVMTCPHLDDNNLCRIYRNRPLSCQAFPLDMGWRGGRPYPFASTTCPQVPSAESELKVSREIAWANAALSKYIWKNTTVPFWTYPLDRERWIPLGMFKEGGENCAD